MAGRKIEDLVKTVAQHSASVILRLPQRLEQDPAAARESADRKPDEVALALAMLKAVLGASTDGILITGDHSRVTGFNKKFVQLWQLPHSALETRDLRTLINAMAASFVRPEALKLRIEAVYRDALATTSDRFTLADNRVIECHSRAQVVEDRVVGRAWSFHEIKG
jgi:PAS domain-containing protein